MTSLEVLNDIANKLSVKYIETKEIKNKIFDLDNKDNYSVNFKYSDRYHKFLGKEIAYKDCCNLIEKEIGKRKGGK